MRYTIVDDNDTDRMLIEVFAQKHPQLQLHGSFENPLEAAELMNLNPPDLLFLDIEMPVLNGLDFFRSLKNPPLSIFITSHPDFALDAFELYALDYILKPLTPMRFDIAVARAGSFLELQQKALRYEHYVEKDTVVIQEGYEVYRVLFSDIIYLEALKDYTRVYTNAKCYITLGNLSQTLIHLNMASFLRIHRSYAINIRHVNRIVDHTVYLNDIEIPIGKTYRYVVNELKGRG